MIIAALLAAALAAPVSAQTVACQSNEMTAAWEKITFGLWLTPYTNPDDSARTSTLTYKGCTVGADGLESRSFSGAEGYTIVARTNAGGDNGATTLFLKNGAGSVELGTWGHHKAFYKGVGVDKVNVPSANGGNLNTNVFFIPVDLGLKP